MRTGGLGRGLPLALVLAVALSAVFIALPASAAGFVDTNYSGKVIEVTPGSIFVLRTELVWDEVDVPGYYIVQIVWEDNNRADENFTVLYTRAFIDNDNDNLPGASPIWLENTTVLTSGPGTSGTRWAFQVRNDTGDPNDGYFDVEIYMQAASRGTPHRAPWDNNPINKSGWGGVIRYAESEILSTTPRVTTIKVLVAGARGVDVSISPSYQSGLQGTVINYTVTVKNTGGLGSDNYNLSKGDNAGWGDNLWLDNYRLENIPQGENRTTTLRVRIPDNATGCTEDNIWVKATSQGDNTMSDNDSCIAHATIVRGVQVVIEPPSQENENGGMLAYTVTVKNTGNVQENFQLTRGDNTGWTLSLDDDWLLVPKGENRTTRLTVNIPSNARGCTWDNMWVKATSKDNAEVSDNKSCLAHVRVVRGVDVSISPGYQSGLSGATLDYSVTVANLGNTEDTYDLIASDDAGWSPSVSPDSLTVPPPWENWENRITTLSVTVPLDAMGCTNDNIIVTATSRADNTVKDNDNCVAHATIGRGVDVMISPSENHAENGQTVTFIVTVRNTGSVLDNYILTLSDNAGWGPTLDNNRFENVGPGESRQTTLRVTIPGDAAICTRDNVTVTATSEENAAVSDNFSCIAHSQPLKPRADFSLATVYEITLDLDLYIENGRKLVVKFYSYSGDYQGENVIKDNLTPPTSVIFLGNVRHPENKPVGRVTLVLTDNSGGVISVIAGFTVCRNDLWDRLVKIRSLWSYASQPERDELWKEIVDIQGQWPSAPTSPLIIQHPGGGEIGVKPGKTFVLSHRLYWENVGAGFYKIRIRWDCPENHPYENFTILGARAYFVDTGDPIENKISENAIPSGESTEYTFEVRNDTADNRNGDFNVDITVQASGLGGIPHAAPYDHLIYYDIIEVREEEDPVIYPEPVIIHVLPWTLGASVSISPSENTYIPGGSVTFAVTVRNTGEIWDNFTLTVDDNMGWARWISPPWLALDPGQENHATLTVTLDPAAASCTRDSIVITATSQHDASVSASASCVAHAKAAYDVEVYISPSENSGPPGGTVEFIVTVRNKGMLDDTYSLTAADNAGWSPEVLPTSLPVPAGESRTAESSVTVPPAVLHCTRDNIAITATSQADNTVKASGTCVAHAVIIRRVEVSISPNNNSGPSGSVLVYTVVVKNTGNVVDNYGLTASDSAGWGLIVLPLSLTVPPGENGTATLSVTIPSNAPYGATNSITVRATGTGVEKLATCTAYVSILRVAEVSISPNENSGVPGTALSYSVIIRNRGNVDESYSLTATDNAGWGKIISPTSMTVPRGEDRMATLTVTIPDNAAHCARDNVTVTVRSEDTIRGSGWCIAHSIAWDVRVSISPSLQENTPGGQLSYSVTVTNSGVFTDNYDLSAMDNAGWGLRLSENLLENVLSGASRTIGLSVLIPDNALGCTSDNITVTVMSRTDNTVMASGGCVAHAIIVRKMMMLSITPSYQSGLPGSSLTYTVTIKNTGNALDNYNLTVSDNAGWSPTLSPTSLEVPPGENSTATLSVTIPSAAVQFTRDNVTVIAVSAENAELRASASCEVQASPMRSVEISISPGYGRGLQGSTLTYTVTIKNKGTVAENFALSATSTAGWSPRIEPASLTLAPGASGEATLKVAIPLTASKDTSVPVMVRATSTEDPTVSASGTCRAVVGAAAEEEGEGIPIISLLIPLALIAIAIIVAILIAKRRPRRMRKVGQHTILRDVAAGRW